MYIKCVFEDIQGFHQKLKGAIRILSSNFIRIDIFSIDIYAH